MTKKSLLGYFGLFILSVIITYGMAVVDEILNPAKNPTGIPFGFASFNFLGGSNDGLMLVLDVAFWFVIILGGWKLVKKLMRRS